MMPRMNGPATFAAIRTMQAVRDIPVIFMTARVQGSEVERYLRLGAIGVVPKPFDPVTLAPGIRRAFDARAKNAEAKRAGACPA
jgi:two-component system, OmpR family, response regulator